jgi:hypothetical protein
MLQAIAMGCLGFMQPPVTRLAGDVKFDPLKILPKESPDRELRGASMSDAELKHGRLAMLAALAYPAQEVLHPSLAEMTGLPNLLATGGRSPSIVNGGLGVGPIPAVLLGGVVAAVLLETLRTDKAPGNYGWRWNVPSDATPETLAPLQTQEVWTGRVAMLAVLEYVIQEAVTLQPVLSA